ncbi:hypothetical protein niasHT_038855 [Heterodera trifolii]|uniref:ABC1 atypical kinase-like domain-containing protein n=1 Tax=Heterodera trifolii TaxID=157864 RepID=A0ABD2IWQ9_9BILA
MEVQFKRIRFFVNVASFVFPELKLKWLVRETKLNLPQELDFLREAANADKVRRMFSHMRFVKIPKIHYNYSSDTILTMEFCEDLLPLGALYSEMIFRRGYAHSDPHPDNILTLPDELRIDYAKLWLALIKPDQDEILSVCERMNIGQNYGLFACIVTMRSWKSVTAGIARTEIDDGEPNVADSEDKRSALKHCIQIKNGTPIGQFFRDDQTLHSRRLPPLNRRHPIFAEQNTTVLGHDVLLVKINIFEVFLIVNGLVTARQRHLTV